MLRHKIVILAVFLLSGAIQLTAAPGETTWIRVNQMGYTPGGVKVAVLVSKQQIGFDDFELIDAKGRIVFKKSIGVDFGKYGPFTACYRLNFSAYRRPGRYRLKAGDLMSPSFTIADTVYNGKADFCLRYMRQQRSGYNPFLKDSCHTKDGYIIYGPNPELTHINVWGGWHDATDYLQYTATSANATYHLLAAYRDFPRVFGDSHQANGLDGSNGVPDILDEGRWGLTWLLKMNPRPSWMFNQIADDRDHAGMRLPDKDSVDYGYGKGNGRPVYFITGEPQGLGLYKNRSTGVASTAGKFTSAFALGADIYRKKNPKLYKLLMEKSIAAYKFGLSKPGVAQTAPNKAPYFYEEDNWTDDMELAAAALYELTGKWYYLSQAIRLSKKEPVTPWMGADTARHYQWYPFHNFGHYEIATRAGSRTKTTLENYYKTGILRVWKKARQNAFYRGIPFIWCSNNLTVSFAIQCYLYRKLTGDNTYEQLEQACFDWLFGCNPWGKCMVYGMPQTGDTPQHPHSSLSLLNNFPLDGALVDGPVYTSIFRSLRGVGLHDADKYADFQSNLAVYHDDVADYSTNEPTMDGTATLIYLLAAKENEARTGYKAQSRAGR